MGCPVRMDRIVQLFYAHSEYVKDHGQVPGRSRLFDDKYCHSFMSLVAFGVNGVKAGVEVLLMRYLVFIDQLFLVKFAVIHSRQLLLETDRPRTLYAGYPLAAPGN